MQVSPPRSLTELFLGFLSIGARSFGGVMPWAHRVMVEERRWVTPADFTETIGLCQFLPGPNVGNASIVYGKRWFGVLGSLVAFLGLFALPFVWVLTLFVFYADFAATSPLLRAIVTGVGAAGAGMFIGTAIKLGRPIAKQPLVAGDHRRLLPLRRRDAHLAHRRAAGGAWAFRSCSRDEASCDAAFMTLLEIALYFMVLSIFSVGGLPSVMPEMQRYVVEVKAWMSPAEFMQAFAVGQAAPGPNMLVTTLIGWHVAGLAGALVALAAMCGPAAVLAWFVADLWDRFKESPWRRAIQRAIAPIVVAMILSGGVVLATPDATPDWRLWLIAALTAIGILVTSVNPLWFLAAGGVIGGFLLS